MERSTFTEQLRRAAAEAREFAKTFVVEALPDDLVFRVHLNSSYDGHAGPEFRLFPEDSSDERTLATKRLDEARVVELLWRDGFVPQWIDLSVVGESDESTLIEALACGRFIDDEQRLYYAYRGLGPFGVKGPTLPPDYVQGVRFSLYRHASCWSVEELERARQNAAQVWFLELQGPSFDDRAVSDLSFPKLEVLELGGVSLTGAGFAALRNQPLLRHLRCGFAATAKLDFSSLSTPRQLETMALRSLPPRLEGVSQLAGAITKIRELTLGSSTRVSLDAPLPLPELERLTLEFPTVPKWLRIPAWLKDLSVRAPEATEAELGAMLVACPPSLEGLVLRGTPVSDALFAKLERFPRLRYLDVVDTRVSRDALRRFVEARPGFKCWPALERAR